MKLFAFKCKKVLTFGLGSVIIGTVKKRQSEYTYEKGLFPWLYIRGVSTSKGYKKDVAPETPDFIGGFAVSTAEKTTSDFVDVKKILFPF